MRIGHFGTVFHLDLSKVSCAILNVHYQESIHTGRLYLSLRLFHLIFPLPNVNSTIDTHLVGDTFTNADASCEWTLIDSKTIVEK